MATQISRESAQRTAHAVIEHLAPYCKKDRIEIAGSLRRRRPWVHDIDIVLIPGDSWNLYQEILALCRPFKPKPDGPKIKSFTVGIIPVDLYIADEKTWATLLLIRTGSKSNNIRLCNKALEKGWQLKADGSGLFNEAEQRIAGDTERSIYQALGVRYQEPWERE